MSSFAVAKSYRILHFSPVIPTKRCYFSPPRMAENMLQADFGRPSSSQSTSGAGGANSSHQSKSSSGRRRSLPSNSCHTKLEPLRLSQQWRVDNFAAVMKLSKPGVCLRSQVFKDSVQFPEACWQLCLYPGGKREENVNNVSLFLKMSATTPSKEVGFVLLVFQCRRWPSLEYPLR